MIAPEFQCAPCKCHSCRKSSMSEAIGPSSRLCRIKDGLPISSVVKRKMARCANDFIHNRSASSWTLSPSAAVRIPSSHSNVSSDSLSTDDKTTKPP
eukprot:scaffold41762_cov191-Amphora_coffeaeformis.AAC.3